MGAVINEPVTLKIGARHRAAIGGVAGEWAMFEYVVNACIWVLAPIEVDSGACITSQIISIHPRLKAIAALVSRYGGNEKLRKKIEAFSGKTYKIADRRNRIIHDPWTKGKKSKNLYRLEIQGPTFEHKIEDLDSIRKVAHDIHAHRMAFDSLWEEIKADPSVRASLQYKLRTPLAPERSGPGSRSGGSDSGKRRSPPGSSRA